MKIISTGEIRVTLNDEIRRVLAANIGSTLVIERDGGEYRSLETDGEDLIFRRVEPRADVATITTGPWSAEEG